MPGAAYELFAFHVWRGIVSVVEKLRLKGRDWARLCAVDLTWEEKRSEGKLKRQKVFLSWEVGQHQRRDVRITATPRKSQLAAMDLG